MAVKFDYSCEMEANTVAPSIRDPGPETLYIAIENDPNTLCMLL